MSSAFQNRLVGLTVIVAISVILLPDLLDGKKVTQSGEFTVIPLRPALEARPKVLDKLASFDITPQATESARLTEEVVAQQQNLSSAEVTPVVSAKAAMVSDKALDKNKDQHLPEKAKAWTIQLGSFKSVENVNNLVAALKERQFKVYTLPLVPIEGQWNKVFVGPNIDKSKLQTYLDTLAKDFSTSPIVVPYQPELVH